MKRFLSLLLSALLLLSLAACGDKNPMPNASERDTDATETPAAATTLTVLSASPALSGALEEIAAAYRAKTGVALRIQSEPEATYGAALQTALNKTADVPALFALTGWNDFDAVRERCADLGGTALASFLSDRSLALNDGGVLKAIPVDVTAWGLLYNEDVTDRYFALKDKKTSYASMDEITDYEKLKTLAEDMAAHKKELEIDAVFADLPLRADSTDWLRHMASPVVYADVKESDSPAAAAVRGMKDFAFSLGDQLRDAVDLIFTGSVSGRAGLDEVSLADAQKEFAAGKTAFLYTDSDSFSALGKAEGSVLQKDKLRFLPLYLGAEGEDATGLTVRVNRYLAVNDRATDAQKQAAVDFLEWLFSSKEGKRYVKENLGYAAPLSTFQESELSEDPLRRDALRKLGKDGVSAVPDLSDDLPGGTLHTDVASGLLAYTRGEKDWDDFVADVKAMWKKATP